MGSARKRATAKRVPTKPRIAATRPATARKTKKTGTAKRRPPVRKPAAPLKPPAARRTSRRVVAPDALGRLEAQLAVIEAIQRALSARRTLQEIYDVVGDTIRGIFGNSDMSIRIFDGGLVHFPYVYEGGRRLHLPSSPVSARGFAAHVIRARGTIIINENMTRAIRRYGSSVMPGTTMAKSAVYVPLIAGDRVCGLILLANVEREHAFSDADVRLLQTIANATSAALDNARLFDETERLLKETEQRNAELAVINSIQQGMAGSLDFQGIVDLVGDKLREVLRTDNIGIRWRDQKTKLVHYLYEIEHGRRISAAPHPVREGGPGARMEATRQPIVYHNAAEMAADGISAIEGTDSSLSCVFVPILGGDRMLGGIVVEDYERENAFDEGDVRLMTTVAASMGVALENARLFDETQRLLKETEQRNAELAIINTVQKALAGELTLQGVYEILGEKLRELFHGAYVAIRIFDPQTGLMHYPYAHYNDRLYNIESEPLGDKGFGAHVIRTRRTLVIDENLERESERYSARMLVDAPSPKTQVMVPLVAGDQARGILVLTDMLREHAFDESDVRLLETLAGSMSVALENARLFDETQRLFKQSEQRAAELAVVNSVQSGLASQLDIQAIFDLVGTKIGETFDVHGVYIATYDRRMGQMEYRYSVARGGLRQFPAPSPLDDAGFGAQVMRTRQALLINEGLAARSEEVRSHSHGPEPAKSGIWVPVVVGDEARGVISIQNFDREHAFTDSDVDLLVTLAGSLGVAFDSALLFDETQRLLKETEQRAAELAVINSIQQGMAAELDFQAIVDLVGDKLREVFNTGDIGIRWYDPKTNLNHFLYQYVRGVRTNTPPMTPSRGALKLIQTRQPVVVNTRAEYVAYGFQTTDGTDPSYSSIAVPILGSDRALGSVVIENYERENAFGESEIRLLTTVTASMGVALENARLFDETQRLLKETEQRNAELAIINSVQEALAAELNIQGIYDAVGDKIREIFHRADIGIRVYDPDTGLIHFPYFFKDGQRLNVPSELLGDTGISAHVLRTRETLVVNEDMPGAIAKYGSRILGPALEKSSVFVPLIVGDRARGLLNLLDMQREHAFSDSDVRLLQTLANSMSVALENARLFDETQRLFKESEQRAAELAIINSVQEGLAAELDFRAIVDLVGNKIAEIFGTRYMYMALLDRATNLVAMPYWLEHGERFPVEPFPLRGLTGEVIRTRKPLVINENLQARAAELGAKSVGDPASKDTGKSYLGVPILKGDEAIGVIGVYGQHDEWVRRVGHAPAADARQRNDRRARERAAV